MSRTLEQKRAAFELQFIQRLRQDAPAGDTMPKVDQKFRDKMNTLIQKAPVQIMQNGLGQMLAFLLADNGGKEKSRREPSGVLYAHLDEWLYGPVDVEHPCRVYHNEPSGLIEQLCAGDRSRYMQAQQEALALLSWTRKFAAAWLTE